MPPPTPPPRPSPSGRRRSWSSHPATGMPHVSSSVSSAGTRRAAGPSWMAWRRRGSRSPSITSAPFWGSWRSRAVSPWAGGGAAAPSPGMESGSSPPFRRRREPGSLLSGVFAGLRPFWWDMLPDMATRYLWLPIGALGLEGFLQNMARSLCYQDATRPAF